MQTGKNFYNYLLNTAFFLFVGLIIYVRYCIYTQYNLKVIDSDQPFMWIGASDFLKGDFYEPRYYGQSYNTFMEALFAVPLLWFNLPVYKAVPLATHFISLFPFFFMAFYFFFKQKKLQAVLVLALVLCLPAPNDLLNSLPRGFVTGLFFTSFFIVSLFHPNNLTFLGINTALALLGYYVNPNSALVSAPFLVYLFLHHRQNKRYYRLTAGAMLLNVPLYFFFNHFYVLHPDYIINPIEYRMSASLFVTNISNLDQRFTHISPFFENNSLLLLLLFGIMAVVFFKTNKKAFLSLMVLFAVLLFSFCMGKTQEGSTWVYISFSRFYLGIPVFICLFLFFIDIKPKQILMPLLLIPPVFVAYKVNTMEQTLAWHHEARYWVGPHLLPLDKTLEDVAFYKNQCQKHQAPFFLISSGFWLNTALDYGGPAVFPDFPATEETVLEKRYWVREVFRDSIIPRFLVLSKSYELDKQLKPDKNFTLTRLDDYGLLLVSDNRLKMGAFIDSVVAHE